MESATLEYTIFNSYRENKAGVGVLLLMTGNINPVLKTVVTGHNIDSVCIDIKVKLCNRKITFGLIAFLFLSISILPLVG